MRILSILAGLVVLGSWYAIILLLTEDRVAAYFGFFLLAIDYTFLWGAADGRPDMLCVALASAGLASYLALRESNLTAAIPISNTLAAAGIFVHPNGLIAAAALAFLILYFDARRLRPWRLIAAAAPYLLGALAWLGYIAEAPGLFVAQFAANATAGQAPPRRSFHNPLKNLASSFWPVTWGISAGCPYGRTPPAAGMPLSPWCTLSLLSAALSGIRKHRGNRALIVIAAMGL